MPNRCYRDIKIAVLIPCYNEALTIGKVVSDFRCELPSADIFVFDNCSNDASASIAAAHGAVVVKEPRQGKGFVVERMLNTVDADLYVMVDGDDTYSAGHVHDLIGPILAEDADMVVGARLTDYSGNSFRPLHVFGNKLVRFLVNWIGKTRLTDIMSGYRAFNRQVVERIPVVSAGFEIETEMTIQMLYYRRRIVEVQIPYKERPSGSESKLKTFSDGFKILWKIFTLFRSFKPLTFFGSIGLILFVLGAAAGAFPIHDYFTDPNHYVSHVPLAILATGLMILSAGSFLLGLLLHVINWRLLELHNVLTRKPQRSHSFRTQNDEERE